MGEAGPGAFPLGPLAGWDHLVSDKSKDSDALQTSLPFSCGQDGPRGPLTVRAAPLRADLAVVWGSNSYDPCGFPQITLNVGLSESWP